MKKNGKKLKLNKSLLVSMDKETLAGAQGGTGGFYSISCYSTEANGKCYDTSGTSGC